MTLLRLQGVGKTYGSGAAANPALRDVQLTVEQGEMVCIWGASGSGKSTLLNILGLLDRPDRGSYVLDGVDALSLSEQRAAALRSEKLGFIFQTFNLVPVLSALENVMIPMEVRGVRPAQARARAAALLDEVGLSEHMHKRPDHMSGGQRQRVAIARALVGEPALVLADEPTANLDSATSASILATMRAMNVERNVTFVFSTHDTELLAYATRNIHLRDGAIVADAPVRASEPAAHERLERSLV